MAASSTVRVIGPAVARADIPEVIEKLIEGYLAHRDSEAERFIDTVQRIGVEPIKEKVYGKADHRSAHREQQPVLS